MITFEHVSKAFGDHRVLDDLSVVIPSGKITFILGKSGEGKSVTIKHIMGLLRPDKGKIIVDDEDITGLRHNEIRNYRRKFGMLFQQAALFDSLTVCENILFPLREHTKLSLPDMLNRVEEVLHLVGLPDIQEKFPTELSTGEKKRIGLARALAPRPKFLLYDEPTTGMDPLVSEMIDGLIVKMNKEVQGISSIVISHDLKAALATGEYIIMLYKGKVALAGTAQNFRDSKDPIVRQFFSGKVQGPMEFF